MNSRIYFKHAAAAFEEQFHCRLCLHDYTGRLPHDLLPSYHLNPFCTALKLHRKKVDRQCVAFDRGTVQERLSVTHAFLLKRCPFGLLEAVFPVLADDRLAGCIFAGPFRDGRGKKTDPVTLESSVINSGRIEFAEVLPVLPRNLNRFQVYGELLAAFLPLLAEEPQSVLPLGEREQLERFLEQNFHRNIGLSDAAELLSLSSSRASDRIRKIFGKGFCRLLRDYRLNAARKLLARSCFPVEMIAARCGFRDGAYFHRIFRRETGSTPVMYRARHQAGRV